MTETTLDNLLSFVDIFHGCKLDSVKPLKLRICECLQTSLSLRHKLRLKLEEASSIIRW
ncbi:hypothetical protein MtrunA17_Chr3g0099581 [Medicago truncatula]|uniref:Uncharacterized protein n=1 Tax=Medicago truncatula TaxID=3880 RepID=A0A072UWW0_MEDTR|nr:hypothetical protein MTR_3g053190 [Medicago truncatula]RHN67147.1 hypothetical protein MtrunA17_Chr3g0099581 [Medicago truncatula]